MELYFRLPLSELLLHKKMFRFIFPFSIYSYLHVHSVCYSGRTVYLNVILLIRDRFHQCAKYGTIPILHSRELVPERYQDQDFRTKISFRNHKIVEYLKPCPLTTVPFCMSSQSLLCSEQNWHRILRSTVVVPLLNSLVVARS